MDPNLESELMQRYAAIDEKLPVIEAKFSEAKSQYPDPIPSPAAEHDPIADEAFRDYEKIVRPIYDAVNKEVEAFGGISLDFVSRIDESKEEIEATASNRQVPLSGTKYDSRLREHFPNVHARKERVGSALNRLAADVFRYCQPAPSPRIHS
jgi:hypothetical protein